MKFIISMNEDEGEEIGSFCFYQGGCRVDTDSTLIYRHDMLLSHVLGMLDFGPCPNHDWWFWNPLAVDLSNPEEMDWI